MKGGLKPKAKSKTDIAAARGSRATKASSAAAAVAAKAQEAGRGEAEVELAPVPQEENVAGGRGGNTKPAGTMERMTKSSTHSEAGRTAEPSFLSLDTKDDAAGKKRKRGAKSALPVKMDGGIKSRVIYIGHIPHGFYENEMRGFFGQFGTILRLRISRNKKTGKSKHFGFIEFEHPEVAAIVADCMHNYLLFNSVLQVKLVPEGKLHPQTWVGADRKFRIVPSQKVARQEMNEEKSLDQLKLVLKRRLRSEEARRVKLAALGIDYDFPSLKEQLPPEPKHIKFKEEVDKGEAPLPGSKRAKVTKKK